MSELKPCPCGKTPNELNLNPGSSCKWAYASGSCCNEWDVEFRTSYHELNTEAAMNLAIAYWNDALRK